MMNLKRSIITLSLLPGMIALFIAPAATALSLEELLSAMPPENADAAALIFEKTLEEGPALIKALCARITPSENSVDAEAKFALYGLVKHAGRPGNNGQAALVARIFEETIRRSDSAEVRSFFMYLLRFCADDASVAVLASLICDGESGLDAIQTIEAIGGDAAITVLILADCPPAADAIAEAVARLRNEAPYTAEETGLSEELLQLVLKPESCTDKAAAVAQCREALAGEELPRPSRCMVLRALVQLAGKEALPELIAAQSNTDPVYQGCGRELARSLSGEDVSQAWIFRLEEFDALSRAAVFALLGERGDASAQDAVLKALSDASPEIRLAACRAIDATFGDKALPPLLDAFDQSEETAELQALKEALLRLPKLEEAVLNLMTPDALLDDSMSADKKSICLDIITERAATQFRDFVIDNLEDSDAKVRRSAYSALAVIGDETNIDQFFNSIVNEKRDAEAEAAAAALVSLAKRLDQQDATINQAATLLEKAEDGVALRLIRMLSTFNSANAVAPAKAMLDKRVNDEGTDSKWLRNALEILAVWQQDDARMALLDLWKNTQDTDRRKTALKCYTTSVERSLSDQDAQIQAFRDAKEFAADDREKRSLDDAEKKLRSKK